jgi:hypothetical protein
MTDLFNQIRKKLVIFVHFKDFNISQKPKSSPLSYFAQKTSLNLAPNWYPIIFTCPSLFDLQFVHNLFWLKLKWNARSKLFYCIIYRSFMLWWSWCWHQWRSRWSGWAKTQTTQSALSNHLYPILVRTKKSTLSSPL